jgi:hypothetical protein
MYLYMKHFFVVHLLTSGVTVFTCQHSYLKTFLQYQAEKEGLLFMDIRAK